MVSSLDGRPRAYLSFRCLYSVYITGGSKPCLWRRGRDSVDGTQLKN